MFGIELYMFWTGFLTIIMSLVLYTQQQACHTGLLTSCYQAVSKTKNKFEKLVHLVHFIRMCTTFG
jgi:predicted metal-binding protein